MNEEDNATYLDLLLCQLDLFDSWALSALDMEQRHVIRGLAGLTKPPHFDFVTSSSDITFQIIFLDLHMVT